MLENVVRMWNDPLMPSMDMNEIKLNKVDKEWMKHKYHVKFDIVH
jgi:hypothetical protein